MNKEEKEAIAFYKNKEYSFELDWTKEQTQTFKKALGLDKEPSFEEHQIKIQTLLNLIDKLQKENKEKDKVIDEILEFMVNELVSECDLDNIYEKLYNRNGMLRDWTRGEAKEVEMLKEYFYKKVRGENE